METEEGGMDVDEQQAPPLLVPEVAPASETKGDEEDEEGDDDGGLSSEGVMKDEMKGDGDLKIAEQQLSSECLDDPNFAIICSFLENFGQHIRLGEFPFDELQMMLENTTEVPERLVKLHIALLRRVFKTITVDKWERSLAKFGHTYCNQDGWEIERFGYKKAKLPTKLRILKNLLESQFDYNVKFKAEVNKLEAGDLRLIPLGRDCEGQVYWYQVDNDANLRVYREDVDEESWEIVASNREEFCDLIEKLQKGDVKRPDTDAVVIDEDSNEKEIETNEIILDTGRVNDNEDGDSFDSEEELFEKVQEKKPTPIDSSQLVSSEADPSMNLKSEISTVSEKVESVCAIKTESFPETGEQLSKSSPAEETRCNEPAGEIKSQNHLPAENNLAICQEALQKVENSESDVDRESSTPTVEPIVEEKIVKKAECIPDPQKTLKLHQPYQNEAQPADNLSYSLQTDKKKDSSEDLNAASLLAQNTLLKIEDEIIVESVKDEHLKVDVTNPSIKSQVENNASLGKETTKSPEIVTEICQSTKTWVCGDDPKNERIKVDVSDPSNKPCLQDTASVIAETSTLPEEVSETCQATKSWVCGNEPSNDASETEAMQIEVSLPTPEMPSVVKDSTDSLQKDAGIIKEQMLSPLTPWTEKIGVKKLDCSGLEVDALNQAEETKLSSEKSPKNEICAQESEGVFSSTKSQDTVHEDNIEVKSEPNESSATGKEDIEAKENECRSTQIPQDLKINQDVAVRSPEKAGILQLKSTPGNSEDLQEKIELVVSNDIKPEASLKIDNEVEMLQTQEPINSSCTQTNTSSESGMIKDPTASEASKVDDVTSQSLEPSLVSKTEDEICNDNVFQTDLSAHTVEEPQSESILNPTSVPEPNGTNPVANVLQCADNKSSLEEKNTSKEIVSEVSEPAQADLPLLVVPDADVSSIASPKQPYSISVLLEPKKTSETLPKNQLLNQKQSITEPEISCLAKESIEILSKPDVDYRSTENKTELSCDFSTSKEVALSGTTNECTPENANTKKEILLAGEEVSKTNTNASSEADELVTTDHSLTTLSENKLDLIPSELEGNVDEKTDQSTPLPTNSTKNSVSTETVESEKSSEESHQVTLPIIPTSAASPPPTTSASPTKEFKQPTSALLGLASYDSSSDEDDNKTDMSAKTIPSSGSESALKRKADGEEDIPVKIAKLDEESKLTISNPIVGDVVEEEIMHITGEGSGAMNEGGNDEALTSQRSQTLSSQEEPDSSNDDSQESLEIQKPKKRGRPGRPGKRGRKPGTKVGSLNTTPKERKPRSSTGSRGSREIARLGVPIETQETNGNGEANDRPVRASRRIAQIRMKEEEERRKLEEERLAQLKADQLRKQQRKAEAEKLGGGSLKIKKSKKVPGTTGDYLPSPSASESDSGEDDGDEFQVDKLKKGRKKKRRANGKQALKPGSKPWATSSSDEDSEAVEEEEEYHYEEEEQLVFNESDHEFSPESDLGEDSEAHPSRHARTAKRGEKEEEEETGCRKCGKGDHPEWILLCDKCDQGWHASCLRPQLWVIPEGEWFCPPCQHNMLVTKLSANLIEFDKLLKKRENDILRKQRLAFVNVSLNNVLPEKTEEEKAAEAQEVKAKKDREKTSRRRRILSDEELSDTFINDRSDNGISENSDEDSEDGPIYRLRARRAAKTFDYKEYDDMINSALRASDDEGVEDQTAASVVPENGTLNGDSNEEPKGEAEESQSSIPAEEKHSGKNEAYEKYLQEQEEKEFDSDDELMDEKERLRRKAAKSKGGNKRKKRSFRDLDDYTDEDNSDEDFKGSEAEDDEELDEDAVEEDESEWSGDHEESDDSLARRSRNTAKGKKVKYGRREEYLDVGAVRRSTRARRKARVSYDESDQDDDEEPEEKWQSDESEEEETPSESDDETYGKKKKKKAPPPRSAVPRFFLGAIGKETKKAPKKKKRKVDEDDVDRAWSSSQGSKAKKKAAEEQVERRTRGRKINFKDILDSGESDDDGNIRPKRRRISSDEEEDEAETSRRLAEEIKAANQREAAMYAAMQKQNSNSSKSTAPSLLASALSGTVDTVVAPKTISDDPVVSKKEGPPVMPPVSSSSSSNPLEMLSNSAKSLGGTLPLSSESLVAKVDPGPPVLKPEISLSSGTLEMALSKPVPAPPIPPALAKALGRVKSTSSNPPAGPGAAVNSKSHSTLPSESLIPAHPPVVPMTSSPLSIVPPVQSAIPSPPVSTTPQKHSRSSKKEKASKAPPISSPPAAPPSTPPTTIQSPLRPMTPPMQQGLGGLPPQGLPPGLPMEIGRVPNPTLYQGNPAMRPFHPMWVRNPTPPPYGGGAGGPPTSIGKPPPLNSGPFMAQHAAQRPGFPSQPPPLRIPNPNPSPLQAFQHFKRDQVPPHGMYRMPPGQQGGLPGILAAGLMGQQGPPDARFFGGPNPYGPYGILPPHTQSQPHPSMFGVPPYEFRPGEPFTKEEPRGTPPSGGTSSPPVSQPLPATAGPTGPKDEAPPPSQTESEFGGLVSYFSSQRSEEDMDS